MPWFDGEACGSIGAFSTPTGSAAALQRKAAGWLSLHGKTRAARPPGRGPVQAHLPGIWRALGIHRSRRLPGPSSRVRCLCARRWPESVDECEKDHNSRPQRWSLCIIGHVGPSCGGTGSVRCCVEPPPAQLRARPWQRSEPKVGAQQRGDRQLQRPAARRAPGRPPTAHSPAKSSTRRWRARRRRWQRRTAAGAGGGVGVRTTEMY